MGRQASPARLPLYVIGSQLGNTKSLTVGLIADVGEVVGDLCAKPPKTRLSNRHPARFSQWLGSQTQSTPPGSTAATTSKKPVKVDFACCCWALYEGDCFPITQAGMPPG